MPPLDVDTCAVEAFHLTLAVPSWLNARHRASGPLPRAVDIEAALAARLPSQAVLLRWAVVAVALPTARDARVTLTVEGAYRHPLAVAPEPPERCVLP